MKGDDIAERFLVWAAEVLRIAASLPPSPAMRHVSGQLVRASTSGGANYEEARGAGTREDFVHRATVSTRETREAVYWLKLICRTGSSSASRLPWAIDEGAQLVRILMSSIRNARPRDRSA